MQASLFRLAFLTGFVSFLALPLSAAEVTELSRQLPQDVNAVAVVRVADILKSPRGQKEDWAKASDDRFLSGGSAIPSWVDQLLVGFFVRPSQIDEVTATALATVSSGVSLDSIKSSETQHLDLIRGMPVILTDRDTFVTQLKPGVLGIRRPAIRQEMARWIEAVNSLKTGLHTPYLSEAIARKDHLILAIDLSQTIDPFFARQHLQANPQLANQDDEIEKVVNQLTSLRGATLLANIRDETEARVEITFDTDVQANPKILQEFFNDVLHQLGIAIEDFETTPAEIEGPSLVLNSNLSDESLRRLISLITDSPFAPGPESAPIALSSAKDDSRPAQNQPTPPSPNVGQQPSSQDERQIATRRYLNTVNKMIDDLAKAYRRTSNDSRNATWHEQYARRIDNLNSRNVDQDALNYGTKIASMFRGLSRSLRGQAMEVNVQQATLVYDAHVQPGWQSVNIWGGVGYQPNAVNVTSNLQQVRERQAQAILAGAKQRDSIWEIIENERTKVTAQMNQKYGGIN